MNKLALLLPAGIMISMTLPLPASATHPESIWGDYSYKSRELSIQFTLGGKGASQLRINSKDCPGVIDYIEHLVDGNTIFFEVKCIEKTKVRSISIVVLLVDTRVRMASGVYADFEYPNLPSEETKLLVAKAIEMKFIPRRNN
jgi:hypothetical protein